MRHTVVLLCLVMAGCGVTTPTGGGSTSGSQSASRNFPEVTNRIREACPDLSDAELSLDISLIEDGRRAGYTATEMRLGMLEYANDNFLNDVFLWNAYTTCMGAVIDHVY